MGKSFKEGYFDDEVGIRRADKNRKQKRQKVKDYLKNVGRRGIKEEFEFEFDDDNDN